MSASLVTRPRKKRHNAILAQDLIGSAEAFKSKFLRIESQISSEKHLKNQLLAELQAKQRRLATLQQEKKIAEIQLRKVKREGKQSTHKVDDIHMTRKRLQQDVAKARKESSELVAVLRRQRDQASSASANLERYRQTVERLRASVRVLRHQRTQLEKKVKLSSSRLGEVEDHFSSLQDEIGEMEVRLTRLSSILSMN
eukprot:gnl/Dysnectes_brevis/6508_a10143_571.p1 GENE.gnl/Dysnectes_brevis/6508_a10143_571~~gnl/Dysnectes_brevis/6508_a10143_571.p1  ORF type:complete len:198 (-),score=1.81 gnl/Dysnectes_brevis/6508_a10143_571:79-672(-)